MAKEILKSNLLGGSFSCPSKREATIVQSIRRPVVNRNKDAAVRATIEKALMGKMGRSWVIKDEISSQLKAEDYELEATREADINEATHWVSRYLDWETRTAKKGDKYVVPMNSEVDAEVWVDYFFVTDMKVSKDETIPCITATKVKCKVRDVSTSGRTPDTNVRENKEIYALILAAKQVAEKMGLETFYAKGEYIYLRVKDDGKPTPKCPSGWVDFSDNQRTSHGVLVEGGKLDAEGERTVRRYQDSLASLMSGYACTKTQCTKCDLYEKCTYKVTPKGVVKEEKPISIAAMTFSPQQKAIIAFDSGVARVIAGAGAGKTTVSVMNTATKIGNGADASRMLNITFTNAGAKATRTKLAFLLEDYGMEDEAEKVTICTFHSFCQEIIAKHYDILGFEENPVIEDMIDQYDVVKSILKDTGIKVPGENHQYPTLSQKNFKGVVPSLIAIFNQCKANSLTSTEDIMKHFAFDSEKAEIIANLLKEYERRMTNDVCAISYEDVIMLALKVINLVPSLFEDEFIIEHIQVDEFQDSSLHEVELLKAMMQSSHFKSLMVIGDDLQAIYGFRGGEVDVMLNLPTHLGCAVKDFYLTDNYRSTEPIIAAANQLATRVTKRLPKTLVSKVGKGAKPKLWGFERSKNEFPAVAKAIKELVDGGVALCDIAFLGFKRSDVANMQSELTKLGVYALPATPMRYMDNSKVLATIGLAEYFTDDTDTVGLYNFLNALMDNELSVGEEGVQLLSRNQTSVNALWLSMDDEEKKDFFLALINALDDGDDIFHSFVDTVNQRKARHISDILSYVRKYKTYQSNGEARIEGEFNAVTCTTLHSSKGLEWKYVFLSLSSLDELKATYSNDRADEMRRLLFVGVTRAQKELVVSSVQRYSDGVTYSRYNKWYYEMSQDVECYDHSPYYDKEMIEAEIEAKKKAKADKKAS